MGALLSYFIHEAPSDLWEGIGNAYIDMLGLVVKSGIRIKIDGHVFQGGVIVEPKPFEEYSLLEQRAATWHAEFMWQKRNEEPSDDCSKGPSAWGITGKDLTLSHDEFIDLYKRHVMAVRKGLDYDHSVGGSSNQWRYLSGKVSNYVEEIYGFRGWQLLKHPYNWNNLPAAPDVKPVKCFATVTQLERFAALFEGYKSFAKEDDSFWNYWDRVRPADPGFSPPNKEETVERVALQVITAPGYLEYAARSFRDSFWSDYTRIDAENPPAPTEDPEYRYVEGQYRHNAKLLFADLRADAERMLAKYPAIDVSVKAPAAAAV